MSLKQWLALMCFYLAYLLFGACVFYHTEHTLESQTRMEQVEFQKNINELLTKVISPDNETAQEEIFNKVGDYCGKSVSKTTPIDDIPYIWTFFHSFHFSLIACSTIGYGNISPHTSFGRIFVIFFTLIGTPVHGILFAYLGEYFGRVFTGVYGKYKEYKMANNKNYVPRQLGMIGQIIMYLIPGVVIFIFIPAAVFSYFEGWSYLVSVYYSYITLTTIGFGDFAASYQLSQPGEFGWLFVVYEIFIIIWTVFGLGYLLMIVTFIAKGLQSKRMKKLEHQLSQNIKVTQNRIWGGVAKDIGYLRRILNEMYIMRFKPVYNETSETPERYNLVKRSSSCPDLTLYRTESPRTARKRALSENHIQAFDQNKINKLTLSRVQSETDISRIDRKKTFEQNDNMMKNGELLARVVTALGNIRPADDDEHSVLELGMDGGVHGFSDSQILSSERSYSRWSLAPSDGSFAQPPSVNRSRAASDFVAVPPQIILTNVNEHTWSGSNSPTKILTRENSNRRNTIFRTVFNSRNRLDSNHSNHSLGQMDQIPEPMPRAINHSLINKLNPFRNRLNSIGDKRRSLSPLDVEGDTHMTPADNRRGSSVSLARQYLDATAKGRQSIFSVISQQDDPNMEVLEKTTIADLIRALEIVHTKVNLSIETPLRKNKYESLPKRKLGTASLTPPKVPPLYNLFQSGPAEEIQRRGSLRPTPGYTTIFSSNTINQRKPSSVSTSAWPAHPPPYSIRQSPRPANRKFSVRPTNLSIPPGQAPPPSTTLAPSAQASSSLQRKLSSRPNITTQDNLGRGSGRFLRPTTIIQQQQQQQQQQLQQQQQQQQQQQGGRNLRWRAAQLHAQRTRHGSLAELGEINQRRRTESK